MGKVSDTGALGGPIITAAQCETFAADGFTTLDSIAPPEEIPLIRETLLRLFEQRAGFEQGALFDLVAADGEPGDLPQFMNPSVYAPFLRTTGFRRRATSVARQLLGESARLSSEYAILKPARRGAETPWHQDEAFKIGVDESQSELSIWMPLQPATLDNGCLLFIPGSHAGPLLPHRSFEGDARVHALECLAPFDRSAAVACPVPPGGCVIHDRRTIHGAGPNTTEELRLAYVLMFDTPGRGRAGGQFEWLAERRTEARARQRAWRRRGGWILEGWRRLTAGGVDLRRAAALVGRTLRNWRAL